MYVFKIEKKKFKPNQEGPAPHGDRIRILIIRGELGLVCGGWVGGDGAVERNIT